MIVVVCGVSGTGKTTIGTLLASELNIPFFDADDFHLPSNIEKMSKGIPLNDDDRRPWLEQMAEELPVWESKGGAVLACSALKESYRQILASKSARAINWVFLHAPVEIVFERIKSREAHFMDERLLDSQLEDFELPAYGLSLDVSNPPGDLIKTILGSLPGSGRH